MDEAEHCHRMAFIQHGRLVALGSPEQIKAEKMQGQVMEIDCTAPDRAMGLLRTSGLFLEVSLYGALIHVVAQNVASTKAQIEKLLNTENIEIQTMQVIAPSLEDVFIASVTQKTEVT
jgi:ABC-2 type transport system ATP-binding protein